MWKQYRETFDKVCASERLKMEVMDMKNAERDHKRRARPVLRPALAAVLAVCLLGTVAFAAVPGAAELLADYFTGRWREQNETALTQEQLDFIGTITQTVGVSDTCNGVTVTLEAVTAGESAMWMLLSVDGLETPAEELEEEYLRFAEGRLYRELRGEEYSKYKDTSPDVYYKYADQLDRPAELRAAEDGQLMILLNVNGASVLESGGELPQTAYHAALELTDLYTYTALSETEHTAPMGSDWQPQFERKALVAEGTWRLEFDLEPLETSVAITLNDVVFPAHSIARAFGRELSGPEEMQVDVRITSTEAKVVYRVSDLTPNINLSLLLDDGTEVQSVPWWIAPLMAGPGSWDFPQHFYVSWQTPVDLSHAVALQIAEKSIPLK